MLYGFVVVAFCFLGYMVFVIVFIWEIRKQRMKKNTANNLGRREALQVRLKIISYIRKNIEHIFEKFSADQATDVTIYIVYI